MLPPLSEITPIERGWSGERKYRALLPNGTPVLYRLSAPDSLERKRAEFSYMQAAAALGVSMAQPLDCGVCADGVYTLTSFVSGEDLEGAIRSFSIEEQYRLGLEAGGILVRLHTLPAPVNAIPWESRFNQKIDRKIRRYTECPLRYENDHFFLSYLAENRHLLANRPQCMQHGDFHIGNLMLSEGHVVAIDFNRCDYGDPWEEFNRIVWCAQASPAFARGRVHGYFGGEPPVEFWRLLALYIAANTLSSLYWAIPFGESEVQKMRSQAAQVLAWFENMSNPVPAWASVSMN